MRERVRDGGSFGQKELLSGVDFVRDVFRRVDTFDAAQFAELFAPQGRLVFANGDPTYGPAAAEASTGGFFSTIRGISHKLVGEWHQGATSVADVETTYDRVDGKKVTLAAVSIMHRREDGLIDDYRVFFDVAPIYA